MTVVRVPGSTVYINNALVQLFKEHGIKAVQDEDRLRFPAFPKYWMNGEAFNPQEHAGQLDFRLGIGRHCMIGESVAGIGKSPKQQIEDGIAAFVSNSFHVLLCAFFDFPLDHGVTCEEWVIGGLKRTVILGTIGSRFGYPPGDDGKPDIRFTHAFKELVLKQPVLPGIHWVRLYHMHRGGRTTANEVLLDNNTWTELQYRMASFDWPISTEMYDVRQFLVIRDGE